jgi:hypothetical protein
MTRTTNAKIAGFTFLFYIAVAFPAMVLPNRAAAGEGIAAKLAGMLGFEVPLGLWLRIKGVA